MSSNAVSVLHAFSLYGNPSEVWGYRLLEALHQAGVHQAVITAQYWPGHHPAAPWSIYRLPYISGYSPNNYLFRLLSYSLTPRLFFYSLRKRGWSLIHAHFGPAGWRFLPLAERLGIPLVVSFYGVDYQSIPHHRPVWYKRYKQLFEKAACIITEGDHGARLLVEMGCPEHKIRSQRLGVHLGTEPSNYPLKPAGRLRLVQVASFIPKKGQEDAIRALALAIKDCPGITLTFAGDGQVYQKHLMQLADSLGITGQVTFKDFVPYAQLRSFLLDFDAFIHPSRLTADLDSEGGAPTILFEAMATGIPVISTKHCDIPTVVLDGKNGLLAPENDPVELSRLIGAFYHMEEAVFSTYQKAAREHMVNTFGITQSAHSMIRLYSTIAGFA